MLKSGDKVLVAVSGGQDSVLLFNFFIRLKDIFNLNLHIFHLNHMLRKDDSRKDAVFVRELADKENLPSTVLSYDVPAYIAEKNLSTEEGAREVRYMLLKKVAKDIDADKVALGHTADDQVETFLMRLLRGSGFKGLSAIPPVRDMFIRPLIEVSRKEIEEHCKAHEIKYRVDTSNFDRAYLRNKIRHDLIPYLENYNPNFKETILQTVEIVSDNERYLEKVAEKEFKRISIIEDGLIKFPLEDLKALSLAVRRRILRTGVEVLKGDIKGVEFKHLKDLLLDVERMPKFRRELPGNLVIIKEYGNLVLIKRDLLKRGERVEIVLNVPGRIEISELNVELKVSIIELKEDVFENNRFLKNKPGKTTNLIAYLDADKVLFPVRVRNRLPGDSFFPLGLKGSKKLQDYLVDAKLPERLRDFVPIVTSKDEIVWVVGHRIDDRFKVTDKTQRALKIEVQFKK